MRWWLRKAKIRPVSRTKKKREGALTFDNAGCIQFQCQWGFPRRTCPYDRQNCGLFNIIFVVGRQAMNVSSCSNNNLYLTKANICREDKKAMPHLESPSVGHSDNRWLVPHFPTATASVSRTTSCRSSAPACKSEASIQQEENVVASVLWKCDRRGRALQNRQYEGHSHMHYKSQLDDTSLVENGENQGSFAQFSDLSQASLAMVV